MSKMNGRVTAVLTAYMVSLRQLGNGKGMSRVDFARLMLPHEVKKGQLLTVEGKKLYDWDGEDKEVIPAKFFEQKVATDAWLNNIVSSLNTNLLGTASEQAENESADNVKESESPDEDAPSEPVEAIEQEEIKEVQKIRKFIKKGKLEKSKKLLKESKELIDKKLYKKLKKEIEKAS